MTDDRSCDTEDYPNLLIAIGASAGGVKEIMKIIDELPCDFQDSIVIATHRATSSLNTLKQLLHARITVVDPFDGEALSCARVYVAKGQYKIEVQDAQVHLAYETAHLSKLRRIDDLFMSVAEEAGRNAVGIILSGALSDGVAGLKAIHDAGGICIVQHPDDAEFTSMPENALREVDCHLVASAEQIARTVVDLARGRECE